MKRIIVKTYFLIVVFIFVSSKVFAENNQFFVFDVGIGFQIYKKTDEFVERDSLFGDYAGLSQAAVEFYVFGEIGFGFRYISLLSANNPDEEDEVKDYKSKHIGCQVLTLNLVPLGANEDSRVIIILGAGTGTYEAKHKHKDSDNPNNNYTLEDTSQGDVKLVQLYYDWGGDQFGFRIGAGYMFTNFEDIEIEDVRYEVSADGAGFYVINVRYAF